MDKAEQTAKAEAFRALHRAPPLLLMANAWDAVSARIFEAEGFAAVATDIADIRKEMATKDQGIALHTQVNSIERQLRETKTDIRLSDLEEKVFGETRR